MSNKNLNTKYKDNFFLNLGNKILSQNKIVKIVIFTILACFWSVVILGILASVTPSGVSNILTAILGFAIIIVISNIVRKNKK